MLCNSCGFKVPDNARFCKNCGAEVNAAQRVAFHEGAFPSIVSHKLQPVTQTAPRRSAVHQQQQTGRLVKPMPAPTPTPPYPHAHPHPKEEPLFQLEPEPPQPMQRKQSRSASSAAASMGELSLAEGEILIRTYHCTAWRAPWFRFPKDDFNGYLTVTNRRIAYRSLGDGRRSIMEMPVEAYRGFECRYGYRWNMFEFILGLIISVAGVCLLVYNAITVPLIVFLTGIIVILMSHHRTMSLRIHSEPQSVSPISLVSVSKLENIGANDASDVGVRAEQTDAMMTEFGAIVADVLEMGDRAAEKWAV